MRLCAATQGKRTRQCTNTFGRFTSLPKGIMNAQKRPCLAHTRRTHANRATSGNRSARTEQRNTPHDRMRTVCHSLERRQLGGSSKRPSNVIFEQSNTLASKTLSARRSGTARQRRPHADHRQGKKKKKKKKKKNGRLCSSTTTVNAAALNPRRNTEKPGGKRESASLRVKLTHTPGRTSPAGHGAEPRARVEFLLISALADHVERAPG
jgi:hypothetical protein